MSEALEDLALELYGKERAAKFFSETSKPRSWVELAANSDTWSPCRTLWEFAKESRRLREMRELLEGFAALTEEQWREHTDKTEGLEVYTDALENYLLRSLTEWECEVKH